MYKCRHNNTFNHLSIPTVINQIKKQPRIKQKQKQIENLFTFSNESKLTDILQWRV